MFRKSFVILFSTCSIAFGQPSRTVDSARVVILSSRLGAVINREARDRFKLFTQISDFRRAVVFQRNDSSFVLRVFTGKDDEMERDTTMIWPISTLKMMAEKVDHFEGLMDGTYRIGQQPATLRYAEGDSVVLAEIRPVNSQRPRFIPLLRVGFIPLAPDPGYPRLREFPSFGLGFGFRSSGQNFSGLSPVYNPVPTAEYPMISFSFEMAFSEAISIQADGAHSLSENSTASGWIGVVYYVSPFEDQAIRPYISAGIALCSVEIREGLNTDAGAMGIFGQIGLEYLLGNAGAIDAFAEYQKFPKVSTVFNDVIYPATAIPVSLDLSSFSFGFRIKVFE